MPRQAILLATLETKESEADFLASELRNDGLKVETVDISLNGGRSGLTPERKVARTAEVTEQVAARLLAHEQDRCVFVGIGGGTGGDMVLGIFRHLPPTVPKVLITPLPFDPRPGVADSAVTIVPTLVDIAGLNPTLRTVLRQAAAQIAGLCRQAPSGDEPDVAGIALTALGVTGAAADALVAGLAARGREATVFHANGYGGAAFARLAGAGAFDAVIDLTPHELTRMTLAGAHVPMPDRFTAAAARPQVVLPGGLNFLGLGTLDTLPPDLAARPRYRHSRLFTHVQVSAEEMAELARLWAGHLNAATGPVEAILPMGGFSHEDRPGGAIESPELRAVCRQGLEDACGGFRVRTIPHHINAPETAAIVLDAVMAHL